MNESDSEDDLGPQPILSTSLLEEEKENEETTPLSKKPRTTRGGGPPFPPPPSPFESLYLSQLPTTHYYEHSYMHRDIISHVIVSPLTDFLVTGSIDGQVKFWKKTLKSIDFVKHYQAHLLPLQDMVLSPDGKTIVTIALDQMMKIFDILAFDMIHMIPIKKKVQEEEEEVVEQEEEEEVFLPHRVAWLPINSVGLAADRLAVSDYRSGRIRVYKTDSSGEPLIEITTLHRTPVVAMVCVPQYQTIISTDQQGMIEYWDCATYDWPKKHVSFSYKSETALFTLCQVKTVVATLAVSPNGRYFATLSRDKEIRLFHFASGKLLQMEREVESSSELMGRLTLLFDSSSSYLLFTTLRGIKVVCIKTNRVVRIIGDEEKKERFLSIALYQGVPQVDTQLLLARGGGGGGGGGAGGGGGGEGSGPPQADPTIFATALRRKRFFCFSTREPDETVEARDKFNELPTEDDRQHYGGGGGGGSGEDGVGGDGSGNKVGGGGGGAAALPRGVVLHTTFGDITLRLFPNEAPLAVENFTTHCQQGYYNHILFHRVINGFMIQTGDPLGDGTGGESIWKHDFKDEFTRSLRHDRPYTVSMANAGRDSNGSQFFITTVPTPWLDGKHTIFGRVSKGYDVVNKIEQVKVNKMDKPLEMIQIISTEVLPLDD
eukprot:gene10349-11457_t